MKKSGTNFLCQRKHQHLSTLPHIQAVSVKETQEHEGKSVPQHVFSVTKETKGQKMGLDLMAIDSQYIWKANCTPLTFPQETRI